MHARLVAPLLRLEFESLTSQGRPLTPQRESYAMLARCIRLQVWRRPVPFSAACSAHTRRRTLPNTLAKEHKYTSTSSEIDSARCTSSRQDLPTKRQIKKNILKHPFLNYRKEVFMCCVTQPDVLCYGSSISQSNRLFQAKQIRCVDNLRAPYILYHIL